MRISYWSSDVCSSDLPPGRFSKRISATSDASNPASWASEKRPSSSTLFSSSLILSFLYQTSYEIFGLHESGEDTYSPDCSSGLGGNRSGSLIGLVFTRTITLKHGVTCLSSSDQYRHRKGKK